MDFLSPVISLLSCSIDYAIRLATAAENLDQMTIDLEKAMEELSEVRDDLNKQIDQAELLGLTLTSQVNGWLARVDKVEAEVRLIRDDITNRNQHQLVCCRCLSRYGFCDKLREQLVLVNDLKGKGKLEVVLADGLLLVPVVEIPSRPAVGLDLMLDKVRRLLREDEANHVGTIGIYGVGGVGKTTLLKCLNNGFQRSGDHGFQIVIWAPVSKDVVIEKIQQAIGERLGLSWDKDQFQELRSRRIYSVMRRKKFLLLLDDVWEGSLDLEEIGIPIPSKENGSKVVFTTRSMEVCGYMDADCRLRMEFLDENESWRLFLQKVGDNKILSSPLISSQAKSIVRKCGGLPLALVNMGRAMANKETEEEWFYAVQALHKTPSEVRGMEDVFMILKFSYDSLSSDVLRSCLLYCSLFPEDYSIEKEQLVEYWEGEGFFDRGIYLTGHTIIGSLKNACFLETGEDESRVKMHGVIRSFALWILSGNRKLFIVKASEGLSLAPPAEDWEPAERVSLVDNEITELSGKIPTCANLSTLLLQWNSGLSKISDEFFQDMPALKVLDLSFTSIKELPKSICKLMGIRHLDLSGTKLRTLPRELGSLTNLQHLNVQRNQHLITIPREAISGLSQLRALNLYYSYSSWDLQDSIEEVRLPDLECLMSLDSLGITVTHLSSLTKVSRSESLRKCIQYLYIKECEGLYNLPVSSYLGDGDRLRRLSINNCMDLKYLAVHEAEGRIWLPNLEFLSLNGLPRLRSIWGDGGMSYAHGCLMNLRCVNIWYCHKLKSVSWVLRLPKLETLYVFYCREMEEVVCEEDVTEEDYKNAFPNLRNLSIRDVPELRSICGRAIFFPSLRKIAVIDCPKLRKLPLKAHTASEMPTVYCYKEWWENLAWDDNDTKHNFLPYFTEA